MRATRGVGRLLNDILWSDPTDSDCLEGVLPNARGPNTVQYGPDRVRAFCDANGLKLVIRAHQCVNDGFEYFAQVGNPNLCPDPNPCPRPRPRPRPDGS